MLVLLEPPARCGHCQGRGYILPRPPGLARNGDTGVGRAVVFDLEDFAAWALADYGKAPDTVYYYKGRLAAAIAHGFDPDLFLSSPDAAVLQHRALVAKLKSPPGQSVQDGVQKTSGHTLRGYVRVINWVSAYAEMQHAGRVWPRFDLPPEPKAEPKTVPRHHVEQLWTYGGDANYDDVLVRCIAWLGYWLGGRRREIAFETLTSLKELSGEVWTDHVGKGGIYHDIQVPPVFWADDKPLKRFLAIRVEVPGSNRILTRRDGHTGKPVEVLPSMAYALLKNAGDELGFRVNFTRLRRSISQYEKECGVKTETTQHQRGHVKIQSTEHYRGRTSAAQARGDLANNIPEYAPPAQEAGAP